MKETEYISKKQALREQTEAMGTDPQEFLGYNPFTASIEIKTAFRLRQFGQHRQDREENQEEYGYTGGAYQKT